MQLVARLVPPVSVPGLAALWWLCSAVVGFFVGDAIGGGLIVALAAPLAVLFYWASEPLESIFAHWYGGRDTEGTRAFDMPGAYLPSGRDLDNARRAAAEALAEGGDAGLSGDAACARALALIRERSRLHWLIATAFGLLDKLCRGLVTVSAFTALGAAYVAVFRSQLGTDIPYTMLGAVVVIGLAFVPAAFTGFVYCRWLHLMHAFRSVVDLATPADNR